MKVTLYTDAGISARVGSWATVAIVEGRPPVEDSGLFRERFKCSTTAEMRAIANALHRMVKRGEIKAGDEVTIRSDNQHAVDGVNGRRFKKKREMMAEALDAIAAIASGHGLKIEAFHVKGHQKADSPDPHAVHNRRCDKLVRDARKPPTPPPEPKGRTWPKKAPAPPPGPSKARRAIDTARKLAGAL